jgi:hypothetical protein
MSKNAFRYFILSASIVILIGIVLQIADKNIFFYKDPEKWTGSSFLAGWAIMAIGAVMLLMGFFLRWIVKKEDKRPSERPTPRVLTENDWTVEQGPGS